MKAIALAVILGFGLTEGAIAQVIPDSTVGTTVTSTNRIEGGTRTGNNLFHSFSQFSIPTGGSAFFNNPVDIQNIFSRVTGNTQSSINGLIQANGAANLFLMNPNGIVFGPNATLNIGGSFIGTTANSIKFADGVQFSAGDLTPNPLLTVSLPIGLQMGSNSGAISIQGTGHNLISPVKINPSINVGLIPVGFSVQPAKTLALLGNNINLKGGVLTALGGRIELGSVRSPEIVDLNQINSQWNFGYSKIQEFGDINLNQRSIVNVSGAGNNAIQLQGKTVSILDSSALFIENQGSASSVGIHIRATDAVNIETLGPNSFLRSGLYSDTKGTGRGGDIEIETNRLNFKAGAIFARTYSKADGGNLNIKAAQVELVSDRENIIATRTLNSGRGGDISINTQTLRIQGPGGINTTVNRANGAGGNLNINATQSIELVGPPDGIIASMVISASTVGGEGNAGNLIINTAQLTLKNGAQISSSAYDLGNGGAIYLNASKSIEITGTRRDQTGMFRSSVFSAGILIPPLQRLPFGLSDTITGAAGNVTINTPYLNINNGAEVSVGHQSIGKAGNLFINTNQLTLSNQGRITASTASGNGGVITINTAELLKMRYSSFISSNSIGKGDGGNISIHSPIIVGLENSDIIANAFAGNGGKISITTQGILGLKYRDRLTAENDITASSEFGINGTVQVNSLGLDPSSGLVKLNGDVIDSSRSIAKGCAAVQGNRFVSTGRGGIPSNPIKKTIDRSWHDLRAATTSTPIIAIQNPSFKLVEATRIQTNPDGTIALIDGNAVSLGNNATCAGAF